MRPLTLSGRAVAALALVAGFSFAGSLGATRTAEATVNSAVTATGSGPFAGLKVTVSQTTHLINQVISLRWSGGAPTEPTSSLYGINYLQVMQCWGDDPTGPRREQCQFGGDYGDSRGGGQVTSRQVSYGSTVVDPAETYQPKGQYDTADVPFESVTGKTVHGSINEFFDANTTNEIPFGRTRSDGTGQALFEVQTGLEAPGLGCGQERTAGVARSCWLVVVPRDEHEVDGTSRSGDGSSKLLSSPLAATNWSHRIVVKLEFERVGLSCSLAKERRIVGNETAIEAVNRWQPALCAGGGATYSYSQVSDGFARRQLLAADPGLAVVNNPLATSGVPADRNVVYAPIAVTGLSIAFLIERSPAFDAPDSVQALDGSQVQRVKLTPRLVAKLLTQSYVNAGPKGDPGIASNPETLSADPEFVGLNPEFAQLFYVALSDARVSSIPGDATELLWQWILGDPEAKAWLGGKPDPWGMKVNPANRGISGAVETFPKGDTFCQEFAPADGRKPLCALERRGYSADMHDAARAASRGDLQTRQTWDPLSNPPSWKKSEPLPNGSRAVIAVTDTPTALRYGLFSAALRNEAGQFVTPTPSSMRAALGVMTKTAEGTLKPAPLTSNASAYPLTQVVYAATAPAKLTKQEASEYAAFVRYAVGDGQRPGLQVGRLPDGYLPLTSALVRSARAAAADIVATAATPVLAPTVAPTATSVPTAEPRTDIADGVGGPTARGEAPVPEVPAGDGIPAVGPTPSPQPGAAAAPPADLASAHFARAALGAGRFGLVAVLILGLLAMSGGPVLLARQPGGLTTPRHHRRPANVRRLRSQGGTRSSEDL